MLDFFIELSYNRGKIAYGQYSIKKSEDKDFFAKFKKDGGFYVQANEKALGTNRLRLSGRADGGKLRGDPCSRFLINLF